ncbi:MAG: hypothetical protein R3C49_20310 [Planctomycetaceae bacterium]
MYCPHFSAGRCRSCSLLDQLPDDVLEQKFQRLCALFPDAVQVDDFPPAAMPFGSRIRARLAVSGATDAPVIGFYGSHRRLIPVADCPLHHPAINDFAAALPDLILQHQLTPYDAESDQGELKFVVLTYSPSHHQLMVQWVLRSREAVDRIRSLYRRRAEAMSVTVMSVNLQPVRTSIIQGPDEILISEQAALPVNFCDRTLWYGPQSFIQTCYPVAQQLYRDVRSVVRERCAEAVLELYCGVGTFLITSATDSAEGIGLELTKASVELAERSSKDNHLPGLRFQQHDSSRPFSNEIARRPWNLVICNPPRRGLDAEAVRLLNLLHPRTLVYSSCNPETLRRDVDLLPGYQLTRLRPFDMFPMTDHTEVLAVLERTAATTG